MNDIFKSGMAAATRLTQSGNLRDATALIQRVLRGELAPSEAERSKPERLLVSPLIDGSAVDTSPTIDLLAMFAGAQPASSGTIGSRAREKNSEAGHAPGHFTSGTFGNDAGRRAFKFYTPTERTGGARPLIVMLHGCTQSSDDFAAATRMNICAEEHECFVVYPEQAAAANTSKCWNWFKSTDQVRGQGEPSIIAGLTSEMIKNNAIDPRRVYVAGFSAGGAAAAVLAEAYPDLFAAAGVHSGLACGAARDMQSAFAVMSGHQQPHRTSSNPQPSTFVPVIVFHGDRDTTVHPRNGAEVVARAGAQSGLTATTETATTAGRSYTRSLYRDGQGRTVMEDWVIHGAGHGWSGGSKRGSFADAKGPDASREMLRFFLAQSGGR